MDAGNLDAALSDIKEALQSTRTIAMICSSMETS
jgi:hypothetical protein